MLGVLSHHSTLAATGAVFTLMSLRVLAVSRGDLDTASVLLQQSDVVNVLLAVLVDLLVFGFVIGFGSAGIWAVIYPSFRAVFLAAFLGAIAVTIVSWPLLVSSLLLYGVFGAILGFIFHKPESRVARRGAQLARKVDLVLVQKRDPGDAYDLEHAKSVLERVRALADEGRSEEAEQLLGSVEEGLGAEWERFKSVDRRRDAIIGTIVGISMVPLIGMLLLGTEPWVPAESITLEGNRTITAYVVGASDGWVHMLRAKDRSVVTAGVAGIETREVCDLQEPPAWLPPRPRTPLLWLILGAPDPVYPSCEAARVIFLAGTAGTPSAAVR